MDEGSSNGCDAADIRSFCSHLFAAEAHNRSRATSRERVSTPARAKLLPETL